MSQKVLITSALPYANGPLHFGHIAGAYLPGDCYARFQRLLKHDVLYICGSDEYGIAITLSADLAGRSPKEHVDIFHKVIQDFFKHLNFSFDHYSRTTWEGHVETTQQYFLDLVANGFIEERVTDQLYSEQDGRFLADRYVVGTCPQCGFSEARGDECPQCGASYEATDLISPRSKLSRAPLVHRPTKHWFLLLEKFKEDLTAWLDEKAWKPNVVNFIKGYIQQLRARAITRDSTWGVPIPLPDTEGKVLYVWFDAPIGYISATRQWAQLQGTPDRWRDYWCDPRTRLVQFIGKDNIPFHAAIFPAMTMGQNQPFKLVDELPANEFYKLEGRQFSKSDGWYIDLEDFFTRYSTDQIRYVIAASAPETADSEFTWREFQQRCNGELLGKYGNLVNRVLVFVQAQCQGVAPQKTVLEERDHRFLADLSELARSAHEAYQTFKLRRASQVIMEIAQLGNVYFNEKEPWKDAKNPDSKIRMETTLSCCLEALKTLALVSSPIIPDAAQTLWEMLGNSSLLEKEEWHAVLESPLPLNQTLNPPKILFRKIEEEEIQQEIEKLHHLSQEAEKKKRGEVEKSIPLQPLKEAVTIDEVRKLDLRAGVIKEAQVIPKSKKLLKLTVDIGLETRTIVAGIAQSYKPEELIGKHVTIVANLQPSTLMGVESQGMLLAAQGLESLQLLTLPTSIQPGASIS